MSASSRAGRGGDVRRGGEMRSRSSRHRDSGRGPECCTRMTVRHRVTGVTALDEPRERALRRRGDGKRCHVARFRSVPRVGSVRTARPRELGRDAPNRGAARLELTTRLRSRVTSSARESRSEGAVCGSVGRRSGPSEPVNGSAPVSTRDPAGTERSHRALAARSPRRGAVDRSSAGPLGQEERLTAPKWDGPRGWVAVNRSISTANGGFGAVNRDSG
jgi:hypothetical protein